MAQSRESKWAELEQQWREHVEAWRESDETQQAFCRARGLALSTFNRWKLRLADRNQQALEVSASSACAAGEESLARRGGVFGWTEVRLPGADSTQAGGSGFEIVFPRGLSLRLGPRFDTEALRRLLFVLEEPPC